LTVFAAKNAMLLMRKDKLSDKIVLLQKRNRDIKKSYIYF
jgi:hypothetical protein